MQGYKRVDGPSDEELQKKYEEGRKNSPFSNPDRESLSSSIVQILEEAYVMYVVAAHTSAYRWLGPV